MLVKQQTCTSRLIASFRLVCTTAWWQSRSLKTTRWVEGPSHCRRLPSCKFQAELVVRYVQFQPVISVDKELPAHTQSHTHSHTQLLRRTGEVDGSHGQCICCSTWCKCNGSASLALVLDLASQHPSTCHKRCKVREIVHHSQVRCFARATTLACGGSWDMEERG